MCSRREVRDPLTLLPFGQFGKSVDAPRLFAPGERLRRSNVGALSGGTLDYMPKNGIDRRE
jgi:hypothetical protein